VTSARFPYSLRDPNAGETGYAPLLPLNLESNGVSIPVSALLDTGATVNVLPYTLGVNLGFVWAAQLINAQLSGNLASIPTRLILLNGIVNGFPSVPLAFAWTQTDNIPIILGQVNFFAEFDVCFYRSQRAFEVTPKP